MSISSEEAIAHIVTSAKYWSGDTIDNFYYPNNLGLVRAFQVAVEHVKKQHGAKLCEREIDIARRELGL